MTRLRWHTAGESHGPSLVGIVEGVPAGLELSIERIDAELARRQLGYGRGGRMKIECDRIELLSGTKGGLTLGSPIAFLVPNKDAVIERLPVPTNPRPGHADLAGCQKYGHRDPRAVLERASARETASRVAAAGIARQLIEAFGVEVFAHVVELGGVECESTWDALDREERHARRAGSEFLCLDPGAEQRLRERVDQAREAQDSLGGVFEVRALGVPPGLGGYARGEERLTARLGEALFSIPAMKAVSFGLGFDAARTPGSRFHDPIVPADERHPNPWGRFARTSNRCGGLEGGMTNGEQVVMRVAMKPIPSLRQGVPTVDFESGEARRASYQRSDVTSVPAASVVGEAMAALCLTEAFLEKFGGDSLDDLRASYEHYCARLADL